MKVIKSHLRSLSKLSRRKKQLILIVSDVIILNISFCLSLSLASSSLFPINQFLNSTILLFLIPMTTIPIFIRVGMYRAVLNYMGIKTVLASVKSISLSVLIIAFIFSFFSTNSLSTSILVIYWFVSILFVLGVRSIAYWVIYKLPRQNESMTFVAIYGAGEAGGMLAESIETSNKFSLEAIFDEDKTKIGTTIKGAQIFEWLLLELGCALRRLVDRVML